MPETTSEEATNTSENNSEESQRVTEVPIRDVQNVNNLNLGARTIERSRLFVNNISSTIEEMQPLIGQISWSFWPNSQRQNTDERTQEVSESRSDNFIINMESSPESDVIVNPPPNSPTDHNHYHHHNNHNNSDSNDTFQRDENETDNDEGQNNNNNNNSETQDVYSALSPEARKMLKILRKYIPLVLILLVKIVIDYKGKIIHFLVLLLTTIQADSDLKREISKQQNRNFMSLFGIFLYIIGCILFVNFLFEQPIMPNITTLTSAWELLWIVMITDFMMKLITILCKLCFTCFSAKIVALQNRGKYYLMLEATSQLFRCFIPIPFWYNFLFEAYQGIEKFYSFSLITIYTLSKGGNIISQIKLFKHAVNKMMQQVSVGSFATKNQLDESGGICTICHDEYLSPVRLHCKHIFCELCVITWLDRERSCPLCRAPVSDDPIYRDGHTSYFVQLF
ncbi:RING finger and transmembrane domain-containing protein 2 [Leptopilina heterotoma]|uniref:RING finger and transmembrane domain-containing protein 2 n=1 Tax=Leptopilina heterotoma TaxID=63436 RepID=UPI001CA7BE63|nr:RING finger and transmembrane domain-containing protein 2 [Leptopilina heterotoma]